MLQAAEAQNNVYEINLINNGDFESLKDPSSPVKFNNLLNWNAINHGPHRLGHGSPDLIGRRSEKNREDVCGLNSRKNKFTGLIISDWDRNFNEYISTQLYDTLEVSKTYKLSLSVCTFGIKYMGGIFSDTIQIHLSSIPLEQSKSEAITLNPSISFSLTELTAGWNQLYTEFEVYQDSLQFISIGDFRTNPVYHTSDTSVYESNKAYVFLDNIKLIRTDTVKSYIAKTRKRTFEIGSLIKEDRLNGIIFNGDTILLSNFNYLTKHDGRGKPDKFRNFELAKQDLVYLKNCLESLNSNSQNYEYKVDFYTNALVGNNAQSNSDKRLKRFRKLAKDPEISLDEYLNETRSLGKKYNTTSVLVILKVFSRPSS